MIKQKTRAFTLVELIIVITILAILATIWFISFQNYTKDARDWNRLATVANIQKWLDIYALQSTKYPEPNWIVLSWSLNNQELTRVWIIWEEIAKIIKISGKTTDPLIWKNYIYWVSADNKYYQIAMIMENLNSNNNILNNTYANNSSYKSKVVWNYNYPLKYNWKIRTLPSLLFTWNWWDLSSNWIYFIINNWKNLPYSINWTLNNTQNTQEVLTQLTWTSSVSLTWATIPDLTSMEFKNLSDQEISKLTNSLWITKEELWLLIYWNAYNTNSNVSATNWWVVSYLWTFSLSSLSVAVWTDVTITNNCTTSPTSYASSNLSVATTSWTTITTISAWTTNITPVWWNCNDVSAKTLTVTPPANSCNSTKPTNSITIAWTPTSVNQSWQNTNSANPCYYTCESWYGWNWSSCVSALACTSWLTEITIWTWSSLQTWSCKNLWADSVWNWTDTFTCTSSTDCSNKPSWVWNYYQWWRNDTWFTPWDTTYYDWYYTTHNTQSWWLWWGSANDTPTSDWALTTKIWRQWPCPVWWHVPSVKEWQDVCNTLILNCSNWMAYNSVMTTTLKLWLAGWRDRVTWNYIYQDTIAGYWASSPSSNNSYYYNYTSTTISPTKSSAWRAYAAPIRCLKN